MSKSQKKPVTRKQILQYIDNVALQVENNKQAVYDIKMLLSDYVEMRGNHKKLEKYMSGKYNLGSSAQISKKSTSIFKSIKDKYLQLKKRLVC